MTRVRLGVTVLGVCLGGLLMGGCGDSPSEPAAEKYTLVSIDDTALPTMSSFPDIPEYAEVVSGTLSLNSDGTATQVLITRCTSSIPTGSSCTLPSEGRIVQYGTYSREESRALLDEILVRLEFGVGILSLTYVWPPSSTGGTPLSHVLQYKR